MSKMVVPSSEGRGFRTNYLTKQDPTSVGEYQSRVENFGSIFFLLFFFVRQPQPNITRVAQNPLLSERSQWIFL